MFCEILPRYGSLKVKFGFEFSNVGKLLFKNCPMHLSMKLERCSFLIRVVLIDWNSKSICGYELQIA